MSNVLFVPSFHGDVRFESLDDGKAVQVIVHDPTAAETDAVEKLLAFARGKGWTELASIPQPAGKVKRWRKSIFTLTGPLSEVGAEFVRLVRPTKSAITALRFSNGEVHVTEATGTEKLLEVAKESKDEGAKAVSVKRPTMCCPQCVPGSVAPANDVLQAFLTSEQHRDWARHRVIEVEGGTTGHRYLVAHRHSAHAQRWGRITFDADDRDVIHFHDNSHPPEEEVLGAMLCLQHREAWVRNEASCFAGNFRHVLKNPFGDILDGTRDAALMQGIGGYLYGALAIQGGETSPALETAGREVLKDWERSLAELERIVEGRGRPRIWL